MISRVSVKAVSDDTPALGTGYRNIQKQAVTTSTQEPAIFGMGRWRAGGEHMVLRLYPTCTVVNF